MNLDLSDAVQILAAPCETNEILALPSSYCPSSEKVNRFKALVIGGGGIFGAIHYPLHFKEFSEGLKLPIVVLGVGAS